MKVQQGLNNQQAFGMALKVDKNVIKELVARGSKPLDEFVKALPELRKAAETVDITVKLGRHKEEYGFLAGSPRDISGLDFFATPINKFRMNNPLTRSIYENSNKIGKSIRSGVGLYMTKAADFVENAEIAKTRLARNIAQNIADNNALKK